MKTPRAALFMLLVLAQSSLAHAGTNEWTSVGPDGGWVFDAEFHPTDPSTLYATAPSGFYRSTDGGRTWRVTKDDFLFYPGDIAVSPATPERLLVTGMMSGFLSTDGGTSFTEAAMTPAPTDAFRTELSKDGQTAYFASGLDVYRSTDQGQTWSRRAPLPGGFQGALINAFEIDPADADLVYASSFSLGIFASEDGGASWHSLTSAYPDIANPHNFVIDPTDPQRLLAATERGLFISNNRGVSWSSTSITEQLTDIDVDPTSASTLYVSTSSGKVKKSTDGGATWTLLPVAVSGFIEARLTIAPTQSSHLMLLGGNGILISEDGGSTWETRNAGLIASSVFGLTADSDRIYAAARTGGIYSVPAGSSSASAVNNAALRAFSAPLNSLTILDMTRPDRTLFAALDSQVFVKSDDAGQSWNAVTDFPGAFAPQLLASPPDSQVVYAVSAGRIYKSNDLGITWIEASSGLPLTAQSYIAALTPTSTPALLYAAVETSVTPRIYRVYRSNDAGASWTAVSPEFTEDMFRLAVHPQNDQVIYAGFSLSLRRSTDGGITWSAPLISDSVYDIKFDQKNPDIIYAVGGLTVMRSVDAGESWQSLGSVVASFIPQLTSLAIDPSQPATLLVGTQGFGIKQITLAPDLALNLAGPASLALNTSSTFTLTVRNAGPFDATNVRVVANLPTGASAIAASSAGATCTVADVTVTCTYKVLRSGASPTTLTLQTTPTATGSFTFSAAVSGDQADTASSNNNVGANLTVNASPSSSSQSGGGGGGAISTELLLMLAALTAGACYSRRSTGRGGLAA